MGIDEERRKALVEAIREVARLAGRVNKFVEEIREEVIESIEDAVGAPLRPEKRALLELYKFKTMGKEDPEKLKKLIARYMGLENGVDVVEYLRSLSSNSAGHHGEGRPRPLINDSENRGRETPRQMHSNRG